jgi:hypothetical protein
MVHFHGFFPSANNGRDDNNNRGGPEPQVKEEQLERSKRFTTIQLCLPVQIPVQRLLLS